MGCPPVSSPKPPGECNLVVLGDVLVAEKQHLVVEQGGLYSGHGTVVDLGQVDPGNFGPDQRRQRMGGCFFVARALAAGYRDGDSGNGGSQVPPYSCNSVWLLALLRCLRDIGVEPLIGIIDEIELAWG